LIGGIGLERGSKRMQENDLIMDYPIVYHMAFLGAKEQILRDGLACTLDLLQRYGFSRREAETIARTHRRDSIELEAAGLSQAQVRDQRPLSPKKLEGALKGISVEEWLYRLNDRVFFWATEERLKRFSQVGTYRNTRHLVLLLRTASLVAEYGPSVRLAAMNTGTTSPIAHPRGASTFLSIPDFPYAERRNRPLGQRLVEVTVLGGVPNLRDHLLETRVIQNGEYL